MLPHYFSDLHPNGLQLRGDVMVSSTSNSVSFIHKKNITIKTKDPDEASFLRNLRIGLTATELSQLKVSSRIEKMLILLDEHNYFKPYISTDELNGPLGRQLDWLSHFSIEPTVLQNAFRSATILILGCGGTGSIIAEHLVRSGAQNLIIVDGGIIDIPDMNRQLLYYPHDCGRLKTEVLEERLSPLSATLKIIKYSDSIRNKDAIAQLLLKYNPNLMINCADTPIGLIHAWVAEACAETDTPVLFGGVGLSEGTLGPLLISKESKIEYAQKTQAAHERLKDNGNILKASLSFTNTITSTWVAFEAFKFLCGLCNDPKCKEITTLNLLSPYRKAL